MKKALKIFGAIILCLGVIALIVCMCAIPNETKLFFDSVFEYLDKPFVLCGVSVTIGGILLFFIARYILNNTSVGKKHLKELDECLQKNRDKIKDIDNELFNYQVDTAKRVNNFCKEVNENFEEIEKILALIPNKKVQEALNNGKETKDN